jgi:hypothetical protein
MLISILDDERMIVKPATVLAPCLVKSSNSSITSQPMILATELFIRRNRIRLTPQKGILGGNISA